MLHKSDYRETGTPVIMPQDIGDRTLSLESIARVGQRDAERLARYATVENDIVYARRGDVEKHAFITADEAGALCGTGCLRVRVDECKVDPLFVSFYLNRPESRMWIRLHAVGSNMPNINTDILSELPMELPDLGVQRKVGNLLRHIDGKIANNKKLMAELEETARLIYDYWFTQFDFPDENGRPYRSSGGKMAWSDELKREIPEGWHVCTIGDLVTFDRGFSYSSANLCDGEGMPMISLASIDRQHHYRPEELKHINVVPDAEECALPGEMLVACTDLTRLAEIVGCPILVPNTHERFAYSMDLAKLHFNGKRVQKFYLYMAMRTSAYHNHIKQFASGTNVLHLDLSGFNWYKIPLPPIGLQEEFDSLLKPTVELTDEALRENLDLIELRNWLLPMLMNGQLVVG